MDGVVRYLIVTDDLPENAQIKKEESAPADAPAEAAPAKEEAPAEEASEPEESAAEEENTETEE